MKFTDKYIQNLKPEPADQPVRYYRREAHGFAIRVQPSGLKTWFFIYTFNGKRQHFNLGNYPAITLAEARQRYQEAHSLCSRGIDPQAHNKAVAAAKSNEPDNTFGYFAKDYLEWSEKNHSPSWHKTVRLSLINDVLPHWKDQCIASIKRKDAISLLGIIIERAPGQARNVQKIARAVFEHAINRDCEVVNPLLKLAKALPSLKPVTKDRILTDTELKAVWLAIDEGTADERTKAALKLILVTAQRPVEVSSMHRNQIEGNWWTLQAKDVKTKITHRVYLTPTALKLIGANEGYIFPSYKVGVNKEPRPIVRQTLSQMVSGHKYYGLPAWTPHDLRRTARTIMSRLKVPLEHAEAVLNHKTQGVRKVYDLHDYDDEKKAALLLLEAEILRVTTRTGNTAEDINSTGE